MDTNLYPELYEPMVALYATTLVLENNVKEHQVVLEREEVYTC